MIYQRLFQEGATEDYYKSKFGNSPSRLTPYEQLEKYKDNENIYISFRSIDKIGINPQSKYNTPNGIYTYPLKEIWKEFEHTEKQIDVPFAGDQPYIYVIEAKGKGLDLKNYLESDFKKDLKKLIDKYLKQFEDLEDNKLLPDSFSYWFLEDNNGENFNRSLRLLDNKTKVETYGGKIFYITMLLSNKNPNKWNLIFNKDLEYNYIVDRGLGIIHGNEPIQAVFFNIQSFIVKDIINNNQNFYSPVMKLQDRFYIVSLKITKKDDNIPWYKVDKEIFLLTTKNLLSLEKKQIYSFEDISNNYFYNIETMIIDNDELLTIGFLKAGITQKNVNWLLKNLMKVKPFVSKPKFPIYKLENRDNKIIEGGSFGK